ncbi:MAG: aryl-sulfate sulfotransferase [Flavobacteriales bacterium]|nr:aryl-sulfate sulfotransferase [Flavobacteriales bacterium]
MKRLFLIFAFTSMYFGCLSAQNTVAVTTHDEVKAMAGYNLIYPHKQGTVFLLDNCGRIMNSWSDNTTVPGNISYLLPTGNILIGKRDPDASGDPIYAGGGGETIEERTWDDQLVWSYTWNDAAGRIHHDMAPMPNGNVLAIVWEWVDSLDAVAAGRDTNLIIEGSLWPDQIIELQPDGAGGATIVWEWHAWDHLVQDFDDTKANWGDVSMSPGKINVNYVGGAGKADWHHANALDYNADLDQVMISIPTFDELWIIDHSTTTAEAATDAGGNSEMGGQLLYRWGNPAAYNQGDTTDQKLFYNHDTHWIDEPSSEDHGKIMVFNNQVGDDYSSVVIIDAPFNYATSKYDMTGNTYGPATFDWEYTADPMQNMHSTGLSSAQRLANGNTLICVGRWGRTFEVTSSGEIVWEYVTPFNNGTAASQGDLFTINTNLTFRMNRYAMDYEGFNGVTMEAGDYVEVNPDVDGCTLSGISDNIDHQFSIYPNPASDVLYLNRATSETATVEIIDLVGNRVKVASIKGLQDKVDLNELAPGMYLLVVDKLVVGKFMVQ